MEIMLINKGTFLLKKKKRYFTVRTGPLSLHTSIWIQFKISSNTKRMIYFCLKKRKDERTLPLVPLRRHAFCSCSKKFAATQFSISFHVEVLLMAWIAFGFKWIFTLYSEIWILLSIYCMWYANMHYIIAMFQKRGHKYKN